MASEAWPSMPDGVRQSMAAKGRQYIKRPCKWIATPPISVMASEAWPSMADADRPSITRHWKWIATTPYFRHCERSVAIHAGRSPTIHGGQRPTIHKTALQMDRHTPHFRHGERSVAIHGGRRPTIHNAALEMDRHTPFRGTRGWTNFREARALQMGGPLGTGDSRMDGLFETAFRGLRPLLPRLGFILSPHQTYTNLVAHLRDFRL